MLVTQHLTSWIVYAAEKLIFCYLGQEKSFNILLLFAFFDWVKKRAIWKLCDVVQAYFIGIFYPASASELLELRFLPLLNLLFGFLCRWFEGFSVLVSDLCTQAFETYCRTTMRGIQLSLNQTQKVRLQRALEKLESLSSKANTNAAVTVADNIPVNNEEAILKYIYETSRFCNF